MSTGLCLAAAMRSRRWAAIFGTWLFCLAVPGQAENLPHDAYPLTLLNCGQDLTFLAAPQRAVALGQNTAEILYRLGLEDSVAATAVWPSKVLPELARANAKPKLLTTGAPSFEAVLNQTPDFVAVQLLNTVGPHGLVARREAFTELGIPSYISPSACAVRAGKQGLGAREAPWHTRYLYQEIDELARIFGVPARGQALIEQLQHQELALKARHATPKKPLTLLFWFSSPSASDDAWLCGRHGACDLMAELVGGKNVITTDGEWTTMGWESIAALDPTVIVIARLDRQRWGLDDPQAKQRFLVSDPVTRHLSAVKLGRIAVIDGQAMNPTIRTLDGAETLAEQLATFGLLE